MSDREAFLKRQSVGSVFAVGYREEYSGRKCLYFFCVEKVEKNKLCCHTMNEVDGKLVKTKGEENRGYWTFVENGQTAYMKDLIFYDVRDPALEKVKAEVKESERKILALFFLRKLEESQITPEILSLISKIQEKVEAQKGKNKTLLPTNKNPVSEKER